MKGIQFVDFEMQEILLNWLHFTMKKAQMSLSFLDISASHEGRKTMVDVVKAVASQLAIPFTVGGGINSLEDMKRILRAGADKVSLNTAAVLNPELITEGCRLFWSSMYCGRH